ncbi:MAG: SsrA-binding protein, partial [Synergistetes bacterium]|nr:SsrA-binding protein [Synergistota bacterium]
HISVYDPASYMNHDPLRKRKLLLHKQEIRKLIGKTKERGYTLVPLSMYINDRGKVKVELALAKGKHVYDKRRELARREIERRLREAVKR